MIDVVQSDVFRKWHLALKDRQVVARVNARIRRLSEGNPGDSKALREGVSELRIDHGLGAWAAEGVEAKIGPSEDSF